MKCSRCGHTVPNVECYVCHDPDWRAEPDCFSRAKDAEFMDDEASLFDNPPVSSSNPTTGQGHSRLV
jgi:hypothetical protein